MQVDEVMKKLQSKGYWEVSLKPSTFNPKKFSREQCKEIIQKCQVRLRGWYYPTIGNKLEEFYAGENYFAGVVDYSSHIEAWRFYQSGQFVHYHAFWEDWEKGISWRIGFRPDYDEKQVLKVNGIILTLYTVAEIYQLASNFIKENVFVDKFTISMILHDTQGRSLALSDPMRMLYKDYKCMIDTIKFEKEYDVKSFDENIHSNVMEVVLDIFYSFNWVSKDIEKSLSKDLTDFLSGKFAI